MKESINGGYRDKGVSSSGTPGMPVVSIITVVYNDAAGLKSTMESVQGQAYSNIEHIIIDGASTDGTLDLLKEEGGKAAYWKSEPDTGLYDAMNKGLKAAVGDYVWFINAGDLIHSKDTTTGSFQGIMDLPMYITATQ